MSSTRWTGHGDMVAQAVNVPVTVASMDVVPGEIVHMAENGTCKFPADKMQAILTNVKSFLEQETVLIQRLEKAQSSAEIREIMERHTYSASSAKA